MINKLDLRKKKSNKQLSFGEFINFKDQWETSYCNETDYEEIVEIPTRSTTYKYYLAQTKHEDMTIYRKRIKTDGV